MTREATMTTQHGPQEFLTANPMLGEECDWHRLHEPRGVRKCDRKPAVVRDGYGGSPRVRFCAEHDPLGVVVTGDAQTEAEQIVGRRLRPTVAGETYAQTADHNDLVVAALAAAIEVAERVDMSPTRRGHIPDRDSTRKLLAEQSDALSALRARTGEET